MAVLKAFTGSRPEIGLSKVARITGLNKTTTFRILSALESEGLVQRASEGDAYLGPELATLGLRALGATGLLFAAHAELPALAEATQETSSLHVLVGRERAVAALSVGGPSTRLTAARMSDVAQLLSAAASRISERLGVGKD